MRDPNNQGFIHAPSMDHAVTAAILRNGHISNADQQEGSQYTVNLTSERVRRATRILQGMREGQSLGALLGYQFERGLHERHAPLELDKFIQPMRNQLPLDANRLPETAEAAGPNEAIAARNVIDGRRLSNVIRKLDVAVRRYPFGIPHLPAASTEEASAIEAEADRLLDTLDALADVAIAESVHQYARGNFDRAAGMLDAMAQGGPPPEPEVIQTPRTGVSLTHRVALHLTPNASVGPNATPRTRAEPRIASWVAERLPPMTRIACNVTYFDQAQDRVSNPVAVTIADLGLDAIDLVVMSQEDARQGMGALDDLIVHRIQTTQSVAPDSQTAIDYATPVTGAFTLFALAPLLSSLRALLASSRAVQGVDLGPPANPYPDPDPRLTLEPTRISERVAGLEAIRDACAALAATTSAAAKADRDGAAGARAALLAGIDGWAGTLVAQALQAALYGAGGSGFDAVQDGRRRIFAAYRSKIAETAGRWRTKLTEADALLASEAMIAASSGLEADRMLALRGAEERVASTLAPDATPAPLRLAVLAKRDGFAAKLAAFEAASRTSATTISALAAEARGLLPVDAFERLGPSFDAEEALATRFLEDIAASAAALAAEAGARATRATAGLNAASAAGRPADSAKALDEAARAVFGEDFKLVHGVQLSHAALPDGATQLSAWTAAIAGSGPGGILHHLVNDLDRLDPVDEWLAAAARVRTPMRHIERIAILSEGFGAQAMKLDAFQIPYSPGDAWLAAEFPATQDLGVERLLYAAHLSTTWDASLPVYALLSDEWVELLPNESETTGLAFHFDRPNAEPPQSMLLVVPPVLTGAWRWEDVVDAVNETLDLAKQRAVEPSLFDATPYARFLPALMFSTAHSDITIVADLALNNSNITMARDP
jgi:hypothetical protein